MSRDSKEWQECLYFLPSLISSYNKIEVRIEEEK
jgi:hypothetical protein